jgi:hypothetical protein
VDVAAARIKAIRPDQAVETWKCRLEHLPRGLFRDRLVISGLDSRWARAELSRIGLNTGVALWLDMGVRPDGRIARVSAMFPSVDGSACLCCGWSQKDWDAIATEFSCNGKIGSKPTRSPAFLGAAAAAVAAHLLESHLDGRLVQQAEARHYMMSLASHKSWNTRVPRCAACRLPHARWSIAPLGVPATGCTMGDLAGEQESLALPGFSYVCRLRCACAVRPILHVTARLDTARMLCSGCGQTMHHGALDRVGEINLFALEEFGPETPALALADIGILDGDIIRLGDRYLEVGAGARSS